MGRGKLDRSRLPAPLDYYGKALALKGKGMWRQALCCFHEDRTPSLSVNVETGHYRCFACEAGGDLLSFHMRRHGLDFKSACQALGAWR
jgi:DNA primase